MKVEQKREMKKRDGETETYNNSDSMEAKNDISKNNLNYSTKVIKFINTDDFASNNCKMESCLL